MNGGDLKLERLLHQEARKEMECDGGWWKPHLLHREAKVLVVVEKLGVAREGAVVQSLLEDADRGEERREQREVRRGGRREEESEQRGDKGGGHTRASMHLMPRLTRASPRASRISSSMPLTISMSILRRRESTCSSV